MYKSLLIGVDKIAKTIKGFKKSLKSTNVLVKQKIL